VILVTILLLAVILPNISAINLDVEQMSSEVAMVQGVNMPSIFNLKIKNSGSPDNFMFYTFFGSGLFPKELVSIAGGETKEVKVEVYPRDDFDQHGKIKFDIFIKGDSGEISYPLILDIINLNQAFEIGAEEFNPESNTVSVYVKNLANFKFNEITAKFSSSFFDFENTLSLDPYEKKSFEVILEKNRFKELMAGIYDVKADIKAGNEETSINGIMKFIEKDIVTSSQDEYGIVVHTRKISKLNEGNVLSTSSTILKKNIISRLFTTFSPEPNLVEREGLSVYYTWIREMKPGERMEIVVKTNWLLPLLASLLIVSIVILTKQLSRTSLVLKKKVNFVKAKGGEFALKVSVVVTAKKFVEKIHIIDRLPPLVKLHERFGGEVPKRADEKAGRIEWDFAKLQAGESRVLSYIIYSKVGILGKFALPTTKAVYERDGQVHEAESNHAFFLADQIKKDRED
jgi:hypothetical protein